MPKNISSERRNSILSTRRGPNKLYAQGKRLGDVDLAEVDAIWYVCFRFALRHIPCPDVDPNQSLPGELRARGAADGACDFDATPKERRPGRGIRRSGHGKHFRRANHQRAGEVHGMARWLFFRRNVCIIDPLRP